MEVEPIRDKKDVRRVYDWMMENRTFNEIGIMERELIEQIVQTSALVFAVLLIVPKFWEDPPWQIKAMIVFPGITSGVVLLVGIFCLIWQIHA